jgi:hypothetical protein
MRKCTSRRGVISKPIIFSLPSTTLWFTRCYVTNPLAKVTNSKTLLGNLQRVSLYLTAFETLKSAIVERVKGFYSDQWQLNEAGEIHGVVTTEYKSRVIVLQPKDELTACCLFLKDVGCFADSDIEAVKQIRQHRNSVAHEIATYLTKPHRQVDRSLLLDAYRVVKHLDLWWLREVEMTIDPYWTEERLAQVDWSGVTGGYSFLLDLIVPVFEGDTSLLDYLHHRFDVASKP